MSYCIIVEWDDGTVAVNGPYEELDGANGANTAAWFVALEVEGEGVREEITLMASEPLAHYRVRADSDFDDVYVQEMGGPWKCPGPVEAGPPPIDEEMAGQDGMRRKFDVVPNPGPREGVGANARVIRNAPRHAQEENL